MLKRLIEGLFFSPLFVVLTVCLALLFRFRDGRNLKQAYRIGLGGLIFILILTSYPLVALVSIPLRSWVPENTGEKADAVVVLGSDATSLGAPNSGSADRAYVGSQIFLAGRAPLMVLTGASGRDSLGGAKAMKIIARGMGIPDSSILLVPGFDTYQEGVSTKRRLTSSHVHKIVLVTHAYHIPRAIAVFRKQGFSVVPHVVPYSNPIPHWTEGFSWWNIGRLQGVCHEYAGLLVYRMRGWTD